MMKRPTKTSLRLALTLLIGAGGSALANTYSYSRPFVQRVNELNFMAEKVHQDFNQSLSYQRPNRYQELFLAELCETSETASCLATQVRRGDSPYDLQVHQKRLNACLTTLNRICGQVPMTPYVRSSFQRLTDTHDRFDHGFQRLLFVQQQQKQPPLAHVRARSGTPYYQQGRSNNTCSTGTSYPRSGIRAW
ncbi:MAG: hypothetical protein AAGJ31_11765 [Verrucomicrobiota bacterium]